MTERSVSGGVKHGVVSETGKLREVIVSPPDLSHACMEPCHVDPNDERYMLFEDILDLPVASREHEVFRRVLGSVATVKTVEGLLADFLDHREHRSEMIQRIAKIERLSDMQVRRMMGMDTQNLVSTLISGHPRGMSTDESILAPLPNLLFTRDIAAAVHESMVLCYAARRPRAREMAMMRYMIRRHHKFRGRQVVDINEGFSARQQETIEGGDLMVVSSNLVLVGISSRTTLEAARRLARIFRKNGNGARFIGIQLPEERSTMHLDTVFTLISSHEAIVFPQLLDTDLHVHELGEAQQSTSTLRHVLQEDVGIEDFIFCGGHSALQQRREQWTDGANTLVLAPGIVLCYARNRETANELIQRGHVPLDANSNVNDLREVIHQAIANKTRLLIRLPGTELSRGRGGPRCMSCPILR